LEKVNDLRWAVMKSPFIVANGRRTGAELPSTGEEFLVAQGWLQRSAVEPALARRSRWS
jgi:hypothetical protein